MPRIGKKEGGGSKCVTVGRVCRCPASFYLGFSEASLPLPPSPPHTHGRRTHGWQKEEADRGDRFSSGSLGVVSAFPVLLRLRAGPTCLELYWWWMVLKTFSFFSVESAIMVPIDPGVHQTKSKKQRSLFWCDIFMLPDDRAWGRVSAPKYDSPSCAIITHRSLPALLELCSGWFNDGFVQKWILFWRERYYCDISTQVQIIYQFNWSSNSSWARYLN